MHSDAVLVGISGRYEYKNKGIDVFIDAINRLSKIENLNRKIVAFIEVPGWVSAPREDLRERLNSGMSFDTPLDAPNVTHWLHNMDNDNVLGMMQHLGMKRNVRLGGQQSGVLLHHAIPKSHAFLSSVVKKGRQKPPLFCIILQVAWILFYSAGMYLSMMLCTLPSAISSLRAAFTASSRAVFSLDTPMA